MKLLKGFALAFSMFSIIPFFKIHNFFKGINGYSAMFYPLVGFILGSILYTIFLLLSPFTPPIHLAVIIFVLWSILTGALHLDGFSDTVDGLFVDSSKSLEIMKDPHVGGMGMIFSLVFLIFKLSSLIYANAYYLLPIILMLSRLNATLAIYFSNYISTGIGKLIKDELNIKHIIFSLFYSLLLSYIFGFFSAIFISFSTLFILRWFFTSRLGGLNGDIYGFIIEVTELVLLNYIILNL